jgi:hypothetical protein
LGVDPERIETLACTLRLQWRDWKLRVAASCVELPDVMDTVTSTLLALWQFKKFSDSRWITVGCSCRTLVAGLLAGLDSLVSFIRGSPEASDFFIHGFAKLSLKMKKFCAMAALSSFVTEAFLSGMMDDVRLPRRLLHLTQCTLTELEWLASLSLTVWCPITDVAGCVASGLRTDTIASGHVSFAFLDMKVFVEALKHPWSLATGDMAANLETLARGPEPIERTARKMWRLLQLRYNRRDLTAGLELILDCPWGIASAEQQHASATLVKKHHKAIGTETLLGRAMLHSA